MKLQLLELRFAKSRPIYGPPVVAPILRNPTDLVVSQLSYAYQKKTETTEIKYVYWLYFRNNHFYE